MSTRIDVDHKIDVKRFSEAWTDLTVDSALDIARGASATLAANAGEPKADGSATIRGGGKKHRTGDLARSIRIDKNRPGMGEVYTTQVYAKAQEYGRPDLKNYFFIPFMRPAVSFVKKNIAAIAGKTCKSAINLAKI